MSKCSNCQAWIPVDVKQCPECGVEFVTGEVAMADYQEKMRLQYDEVVSKFKEEASRQLGRALSDREFQEWWRKQPTFVTFEDWLREEEEMRKMGSKPCPTCGTLNSVTATVCHKCGSLGVGVDPAPGDPQARPRAAGRPEEGRQEADGRGPRGRRPVRLERRPIGRRALSPPSPNPFLCIPARSERSVRRVFELARRALGRLLGEALWPVRGWPPKCGPRIAPSWPLWDSSTAWSTRTSSRSPC